MLNRGDEVFGIDNLNDYYEPSQTIEGALGCRAMKNLLTMQPGDVPGTAADIEDLRIAAGFSPSIPLESGIARYVRWFRKYHKMLARKAPKSSD